MKLAVGKVVLISNPDTTEIFPYQMFDATGNTDVTLLQVNNESSKPVVINLFIQFIEETIRILPLNKVIEANGMILFENLKYSLVKDEKLLITSDTFDVLTYIVMGEITNGNTNLL